MNDVCITELLDRRENPDEWLMSKYGVTVMQLAKSMEESILFMMEHAAEIMATTKAVSKDESRNKCMENVVAEVTRNFPNLDRLMKASVAYQVHFRLYGEKTYALLQYLKMFPDS